ncbi:MAG: DEAD/DEAH box helicase, partial [Candidatus Aenigmatarchaeota archaeon]
MTPVAAGDVVKKVLEASGFSTLNPVQEAALSAGLLSGKNMVLAAATASGKTLVAEMAMLNCLGKGKKTLYIVPLKALASEKYAEFKEKYGKMGVKVALSVGDKDSSDSWLAGYDVIIVTSEKLDSIIRHGADWLVSVGLVVADEIHLIDSPNRGPTLEVTLTRLMQLIDPQVLALSATIRNYKDLAGWLSAVAVKSDYRPVKLYCGVFNGNEVSWHPKKEKLTLPGDLPPVFEIARDTVRKGKQALVFVSARKSAESLAEKIGD